MRQWINLGLARFTGGGFWALLVRSAAGYGLIRIIGMAASFAVGVQLARHLGVRGFGYYSIALAIITLAAIPSEVGLPIFVMREVAASAGRGDLSDIFGVIRWARRTSLLTSFAVSFAVLCVGLVLYYGYSPALGGCLLFGVPAIFLTARARVNAGAIVGLNRVALGQAPETIVRPVLYSVILGLAYLLNVKLSPAFAMAFYSATAAIMLLVATVLLRKLLPETPETGALPKERSLMTSFPLGLMDAMRIIQGEVSIALAGVVAAPSVVGLLRIANVTSFTAAMPSIVMAQIGMPLMASLYAANNRDRLQKTVTLVAHAQFAGLVATGLPLIIFPTQLLSLAFGSSFAEAATPLRILALAQIANAAFGPNIWLLNMTHFERRVLRALSLALVINILAIPLLAKMYGATGAALALFASMLCWNVITWLDARRLLGIETSIFHWPWRLGAGTA